MTTSDGDAGPGSRLRTIAPTALRDWSPAEERELPASSQIAPKPPGHHRDEDWLDRSAASEFDDFWSEPRSPRRSRYTRSVTLLPRLVGVLAVAFSVVVAFVVHSMSSRRLAGDHITPTPTNIA